MHNDVTPVKKYLKMTAVKSFEVLIWLEIASRTNIMEYSFGN